MAVASLQVTKTYADGLAWTEARMDAAMQSIQTYTQTSLVNNFDQLRKDIFSSAYTLDNDGNTNLTNSFWKDCFGASFSTNSPRTNPLANKQSASIFYNSANISLNTATATSFRDVSSSIYLRVAPEITGKYRVGYEFSHKLRITTGGNATLTFHLFNKTSNATLASVARALSPVGATLIVELPINFSRIVNFSSTAAATFQVKYSLVNPSGLTINSITNSTANKQGVYGYAYKI